MKSRVMAIVSRLCAMPPTLKIVTIVMWISGAIAAVATVLPGWEDANGRPVGLRELWSVWDGFGLLLTGIGMILLGCSIYSGRPWVRHALMVGVVAIGLSGFAMDEYEDIPLEIRVVLALIIICMGVRYLYFRKEVIGYFARNQNSAEQAEEPNQR